MARGLSRVSTKNGIDSYKGAKNNNDSTNQDKEKKDKNSL
jgi:hypothetical protein